MIAKNKIIIAIFLFTTSLSSFAQGTAYANIFCRVIAPVGISKATDKNLGRIVVSHQSASNTTNSGAEIIASGLKLEQDGTATLASFSLAGHIDSTFDITLPSENMKIGIQNSNQIIVSNFNSSKMNHITQNGVEMKISIEADLHVPTSQALKILSAQNTFPVTLNYN